MASFRRHREKFKPGAYVVEPSSVSFNDTSLTALLSGNENKLKLVVSLLQDSRIRVYIDEAGNPLRPRYQAVDALDGAPKQEK